MRQSQQYVDSCKMAMLTKSLRVWWGTSLVLAIGMWVSPEAWALAVSPTALTFQSVQGATNPSSQTVTVSKSKNRQAKWTVKDNAMWLTVSPEVGTITSTASFSVVANTAGLAAGTYTATVTIKVEKGGSVSVPVTVTVAPATTSSSASPVATTNTMASLSWSPVTSTNLAGYKVYVGTASGRYGVPVDVGNVTSHVVNNLSVGNTYYFVVTSYNSSGSESLPSTEVSKSIY